MLQVSRKNDIIKSMIKRRLWNFGRDFGVSALTIKVKSKKKEINLLDFFFETKADATNTRY